MAIWWTLMILSSVKGIAVQCDEAYCNVNGSYYRDVGRRNLTFVFVEFKGKSALPKQRSDKINQSCVKIYFNSICVFLNWERPFEHRSVRSLSLPNRSERIEEERIQCWQEGLRWKSLEDTSLVSSVASSSDSGFSAFSFSLGSLLQPLLWGSQWCRGSSYEQAAYSAVERCGWTAWLSD